LKDDYFCYIVRFVMSKRHVGCRIRAFSTDPTLGKSQANKMSNVVKGPSLILTSLHRPEPTLMILPGLRSLPFWTNRDGQVAYQDPQVTNIVNHLQLHVSSIRDEYLTVSPSLSSSDYDKSKTSTKSSGVEHGTDGSLHTGSWDWHSYLLHGQVQKPFTEQFPITTRVLGDIGADLFDQTPFGFCFFSKLSAKSTIQPHTSPINFRLRIHLPLIVPSPESSSAATVPQIGIRVGPSTQAWVPNQAMVLDDSYDHEVWNQSEEERVILLVDIWHPDVRTQERKELREMFLHAQQKGWLNL
jgi:Aspartyl/Asparaginyl beta-hydroxylase